MIDQRTGRVPADLNHDKVRAASLCATPRPEDGSDTAEGDRDNEAAPNSAGDRFADGTADCSNNDVHDQPWQRCERKLSTVSKAITRG